MNCTEMRKPKGATILTEKSTEKFCEIMNEPSGVSKSTVDGILKKIKNKGEK